VLLLDVDGVLNTNWRGVDVMEQYIHNLWPENRFVDVLYYPPTATMVPKPEYADVMRLTSDGGVVLCIRFVPGLIQHLQGWIQHDVMHIMWLTGWRTSAQTVIAPALGLPVIPVAPFTKGTVTAYPWPPETPVLWVDDCLDVIPGALQWVQRRSRTLGIQPLNTEGLGPVHLERMEAFSMDADDKAGLIMASMGTDQLHTRNGRASHSFATDKAVERLV
jgi:hypothetical protein